MNSIQLKVSDSQKGVNHLKGKEISLHAEMITRI